MNQAVMIIIRRDGKFLLGKRSLNKAKAPGHWCPISGHIEAQESEEEAVIREAREEIGVDVCPVQKITETPTHDGSTLLHWWIVDLISGEPRINNEENSMVQWFTKEELRTLRPTFQEDIEILLRL